MKYLTVKHIGPLRVLCKYYETVRTALSDLEGELTVISPLAITRNLLRNSCYIPKRLSRKQFSLQPRKTTGFIEIAEITRKICQCILYKS